jgi:hypothetical protein
VQRTADVQLLRLALTLFGAMAAIRLFVYVLRRALPRSKWISSFERAIALTIWVLVALYLTGLLTDLGEARVRSAADRTLTDPVDLLTPSSASPDAGCRSGSARCSSRG